MNPWLAALMALPILTGCAALVVGIAFHRRLGTAARLYLSFAPLASGAVVVLVLWLALG